MRRFELPFGFLVFGLLIWTPTRAQKIALPESVENTTTKLTGIPQIDYIHDPNLPRELGGFDLSTYPFFNGLPKDLGNFSCDGRYDGFYASIPHKCQIYHNCQFGKRYDFLCANFTLFDQKNLICHYANQVQCEKSAEYFDFNKFLYKHTVSTTERYRRPANLRPKPPRPLSPFKKAKLRRTTTPAYDDYYEYYADDQAEVAAPKPQSVAPGRQNNYDYEYYDDVAPRKPTPPRRPVRPVRVREQVREEVIDYPERTQIEEPQISRPVRKRVRPGLRRRKRPLKGRKRRKKRPTTTTTTTTTEPPAEYYDEYYDDDYYYYYDDETTTTSTTTTTTTPAPRRRRPGKLRRRKPAALRSKSVAAVDLRTPEEAISITPVEDAPAERRQRITPNRGFGQSIRTSDDRSIASQKTDLVPPQASASVVIEEPAAASTQGQPVRPRIIRRPLSLSRRDRINANS